MKRYIGIWVSQDATEEDYELWERFVKVNMSVSENVRFLVAESESEFEFKTDVLERADWEMGRWGEGWMERVIYFKKEDDS
jgi:hypothetical protein